MIDDFDSCYRAVQARDARFDGWFFTAVTSTHIYCRPSCPAKTPMPQNVRFYVSAAAAQQAGFRACKKCRPDASPGSPEWNVRADVVARAMRLLSDGVVDREGVSGLARRLGYSVRQLERLLNAELGASPIALARAQRAQTARILVETTTVPLAQVAFASGFDSVRQFNETVRQVFAASPTEMRQRVRPHAAPSGTLRVRLPFRQPLCPDSLFGHLAATAVPGCEEIRDGTYRRTLRLTHGPGIVALRPLPTYIECELLLTDMRDLTTAIARCRRLLDLDSDPVAVDNALAADPILAPLVRAQPGRRIPGAIDGEEFALRAILGQQISTKAARGLAGKLVSTYGTAVEDPHGGLTHVFPRAADLVDMDPTTLPMPGSRQATFTRLVRALAAGGICLDSGVDRQRIRDGLRAIPGIGPWTVEVIAMRALGDPDAFPASDIGVRAAAALLGLGSSARELVQRAEQWRPWRSYAVQYLWATSDHSINRLPFEENVA